MSKVKILLYCTKAKPYLSKEIIDPPFIENEFCLNARQNIDHNRVLNGKIVAECEIDNIDYYEMEYHKNNLVLNQIGIYDEVENQEWDEECFEMVISNEYSDEEIANCKLLKYSCLTFDELGSYVCSEGGFNNFYALHLSNVKVFDRPLSFQTDYIYKDYKTNAVLTKAPQNMCNVYDRFGNHYVLISIQPQHLCKILNGEKTIEIRKSILNSLKEEFNCGK